VRSSFTSEKEKIMSGLIESRPKSWKVVAAVTSASLLALPLTLGGATAAQAASPASCLHRSSWSDFPWQYAKVTNNCKTSQTVYFRWDRAVDGSCVTLKPGHWRTEGRAYQARFAGLSSC
jgi:hypothetical protein